MTLNIPLQLSFSNDGCFMDAPPEVKTEELVGTSPISLMYLRTMYPIGTTTYYYTWISESQYH